MKEIKKNDRFAQMIFRSVFTVFLFVLIFPVKAQKGFKFGPQALFISSRTYLNSSDSLPDNFSFRFKSGFRFGLSAQYGFSGNFVLASGLNYSNKGYRVFNDTNSGGNILKHNISNIELPVNMIVKFRVGSSSKLRFLLGGTINYQLSSTAKTLKNNKESFIIKEEYVHKVYPMMNLGVEIANEDKAGNMFIFGIYYTQSFSEQSRLRVFTSKAAADERFLLRYRGSYVGVGISYLFDLKNFKKDEVFFY